MATLLTMFTEKDEAYREERREDREENARRFKLQEAQMAQVNKQLQLFAEVLTGQGNLWAGLSN